MFNLVEYIKRNLINGYKDGTWSESKVSQLALSYLEKGFITLEDVSEIDETIQADKKEKASEIDDTALIEKIEFINDGEFH